LPAGRHGATACVTDDAIAKRAFEKFVARGCAHGRDQEDWDAAERELNAEASGEQCSRGNGDQ